jgi:hypothetical protein
MKGHIYLISFFLMMVVFAGMFFFAYFKESRSKYEELLKRDVYGLPDSRKVTLAIRVKNNLSGKDLEDTLLYAYANELMNQVRKKHRLKQIVIHAYTSAIDYQNNPNTTWKARLEKIDNEKVIYFPPNKE